MTPEQEQAHITRLVAENRHIFIEASAGSGKTTRLTALIAEIISQGKAKISEILCVTFTEKAASELKARIFSRLAADKNEFHFIFSHELNARIRNFITSYDANTINP